MLNSNSFTRSLGFSIYVHGCVRVQHLHFYLQIQKMYFFSCHTESATKQSIISKFSVFYLNPYQKILPAVKSSYGRFEF